MLIDCGKTTKMEKHVAIGCIVMDNKVIEPWSRLNVSGGHPEQVSQAVGTRFFFHLNNPTWVLLFLFAKAPQQFMAISGSLIAMLIVQIRDVPRLNFSIAESIPKIFFQTFQAGGELPDESTDARNSKLQCPCSIGLKFGEEFWYVQRLDVTHKGHKLLSTRAVARDERCIKAEWVAVIKDHGAFGLSPSSTIPGSVSAGFCPGFRRLVVLFLDLSTSPPPLAPRVSGRHFNA